MMTELEAAMAFTQATQKTYVELKYRQKTEILGETVVMWCKGTFCDYHFGCWFLFLRAKQGLHAQWKNGSVTRIYVARGATRSNTVRLTLVRPWEHGDFCFECRRQRRDVYKEQVYGKKGTYVLPESDPFKHGLVSPG